MQEQPEQQQLGRIPICGSYFLQSSIWSLICLAFRLRFVFFPFEFSSLFFVLFLGDFNSWLQRLHLGFRPRPGGGSVAQLSPFDGWAAAKGADLDMASWISYIYIYRGRGRAISRLNMTDEPGL